MALSWLTVLQSVPWSDVIRNAPKVAEGAKNLFDTVARRGGRGADRAPGTAAATGGDSSATAEARAIAVLESRLAAVDAAMADLNAELLASSQLIRDLAGQNAQLIQRVEANRVRTLWLAAAAGLALVIALAAAIALLRA